MRSMFGLRRMRLAQSTIALSMLALPASAFALSQSTSRDARRPALLPVRVSPRHIRLGGAVTVSGRASRERTGARVALESARGDHGRWRQLSTTRIGRGGGYAMDAHPRHSGVLRAVETAPAQPLAHAEAGTHTVAVAQTTAVSRVASVSVKARMRVAGGEREVLAGRRVTVSGDVVPARGGRTVAVQDLVGHGWRTIARGQTGRGGGFAVGVRPSREGPSRRALRVVFAGDRDNARATRGAGVLDVMRAYVASWYEDGAATGCGFHATYGVANKTLPCGTKVRLRHAGRTVTATVDDRGPYVAGRDCDLNQNTAAALDFAGVGTVYASAG